MPIQEIEDLIKKKIDYLSKREKLIANYFIEHLTNIAFLSIHDISQNLNVGRASIVRFANKLGFDGFYSLKSAIKEGLQSSIAPLDRYQLALNNPEEDQASLVQIAENEVENINSLLNNFDKKTFDKVSKRLSRAGMIYCVGYNMSSFFAGIFSFLLRRVGLNSIPANLGGQSIEEQIINISEKDVLVAFSNPPYSSATIRASAFAKKQKGTVISITNSFASPIVEYSDLVLSVRTDCRIFTNSFSAILVLLYALVNDIALNNKMRFQRAVDKKHVISDET